ncbi:MAG TPA: hypothetical protein VGK84_09930 [Candidatus Tumulicola sp.]|jgi:hypothetical protein
MTAATRAAVFFGSCAALLACCVRPATAIPGQPLSQFAAWAKTRPLLAGMDRRRDELSGFPAFLVDTSDHGIAWRFYATSDGTTIRQETLAVGNPGKSVGSAAILHDGSGYGYAFFASLYGPIVAHDFLDAKQIAVIADPADKSVSRFYLGRHFGYSTSGGIVVETRAAFDIDLAQAKKCSRSPKDCSE